MGRKWGALWAVALAAMSACAWAQVQINTPLGTIGGQHDKALAELLDQGKAEEAARYWGENRSWFWDNAAQHKELLARLKSTVNTPQDTRMAAAETALKPFAAAPQPLLEWSKVIRALSDARMALDAYRALPIAIDDSLRSERFISLDTALAEVVDLYVKHAPKAFAEYDHFGSPVFTRTYPVEVPDEVLLAGFKALKPRLEKANGEQLAKFREAFAKVLTPIERDELTRFAAAARYRELVPEGKLTAEAAVKLLVEITAGRLDLQALPIKFAFFWSDDGARSGDFKVRFNPPKGLPMRDSDRRDIDKRLAEADVVVFIDTDRTALAKNSRGTRKEHSSYKSSTRQTPNPAWFQAQNAVNQRRMELTVAESSGGMSISLDPITLLGGLAKEAYKQGKTLVAKNNLKAAEDQLAATPQMLSEDVIGDYQYEVADVEVARKIPLAVYVLDKNGYFKSATEITEKRRFEIVDGLHPRDPERENLVARYTGPKALQEYVDTPATIDGGALLNAALKSMLDGGTRPIAMLPQDLDRGATLAPLAAALAAPAGHCDAFFDGFLEQLKASRQCASDPDAVKGLVERVRGESTNAAEMGILTAARTPELYKIVPANDERWLTVGESAQPNCAAPVTVRSPQDSYIECVRLLSCGARTAACGRELTRQNRAMGCPEASQRCMVVYPVPQ